jgi:hypothetical protein
MGMLYFLIVSNNSLLNSSNCLLRDKLLLGELVGVCLLRDKLLLGVFLLCDVPQIMDDKRGRLEERRLDL